MAALWLIVTGACSTSENLCDTDRFQCSDGTGAFAPDETCELQGTLDVELGQGESEFSPIPAGVMPELYTGTQGAQHAFLSVRVKNAALDRYDKLRADFRFHVVANCNSSGFGFPVATTDLGEPGSCLFEMASRTVVLGDLHPIRTNPSGAVEEFGVLLQLPHLPDRLRVIELEVVDPCGQKGESAHVVEPG